MPIVIKDILSTDITGSSGDFINLIDKLNENFDQIVINGGGPRGHIGPTGPIGIQGPTGQKGPRGNYWYVSEIEPTGDLFIEGDQYLDFDGNIKTWNSEGEEWADTGLNIMGPTGDGGTLEGLKLYKGASSVIDATPNFGEVAGPSDEAGNLENYPNFLFLEDKLNSIFIGDNSWAKIYLKNFGVSYNGGAARWEGYDETREAVPKLTLIQDTIDDFSNNLISLGAYGLTYHRNSDYSSDEPIKYEDVKEENTDFTDFVTLGFTTENIDPDREPLNKTKFKISSPKTSIFIKAGGNSPDGIPADIDIFADKIFLSSGSNGDNGNIIMKGFVDIIGKITVDGKPIGLDGTNYLYVKGDGTPSQNATELQSVYNLAKTMGASATNRITVVVAPGKYTFGVTKFPVNTQYIDIVSLTGNPDVLLDGINVTANNVYLKGLNCGNKRFKIGDNLNGLICENCIGGDYSFGGYGVASGTFTDCTGGDVSFGGGGEASGTFTDCTGGSESFGGSFGGYSIASGTFIDCTGGDISFGGYGVASGTFTDCTGGEYSFAGYSIASGTFTDCTGGDISFGGYGVASGTFTDCTGGDVSFGGGGEASGTFTDCTGGSESFGGYGGLALGTFTNCTGGDYSFGGGSGTASGTFNSCTGGDASFGGGGTASGTFTNCKGGDYSFGGESGSASGTFNSCTGGDASFGGAGGNASGTFTDCTGGNSSFGDYGDDASGTFTNCKGGNYSFGGDHGTASGTFTNCIGGNYSFGGGTASGTFNSCTGGDASFGGGYNGTASGTFINCTGGGFSFGGGTAFGTFTNCEGGDNSFGGDGGTASGTFNNCTGGDYSFGGDGGTASGTFNSCTGGDASFGGGGQINSTARLYYCKLTTGTFETPQAGGKLVLCINGNDAIVTT